MDITAVICEYNPFHNGHKIQIEYIKKKYPDTVIIAVMSGNIVQRGELAVAEKYDRAKIALECGVDVIVELPYPWCGASAGYFALGGVSIAKKIGASRICFGSEFGDISILKECSARLCDNKFLKKLQAKLQENPDSSYMRIRTELYKKTYGVEIPNGANNLLGIEYITVGSQIGYKGEFITYKREENYSATECRNAVRNEDSKMLESLIPCGSEVYFHKRNNIDSAFIWQIGNAEISAIESCCDIDKTLAHMLKTGAEKSSSIEELISFCISKKYPRARVARALFFAMLGISENQLKNEPEFTVLLASNERGRKFLSQNRKNEDIAVITKNADYKKYGEEVVKQYEISNKANRLFSLLYGCERDYVMKKSPSVIK